MTPAQLDHLRKIDAHLERLLALASKRTPGRWIVGAGRYLVGLDSDTVEIAEFSKDDDWELEQRSNMKFIASCAGNAEAGWRATRAAIEFILMVCDFHSSCPPAGVVQRTELETVEAIAKRILATFPLESLK